MLRPRRQAIESRACAENSAFVWRGSYPFTAPEVIPDTI